MTWLSTYFILTGCFLVACAMGIDVTERSKPNATEGPYVVGGFVSNIKSYPYMVSIQAGSNRGWYHTCGGSILSPYAVLTACHCLVSSYIPRAVLKSPRGFRVVAGVTDLRYANSQGQRSLVNRLVVHPQCGGGIIFSDAGVMILQTRLHFNQAVQPIKFYAYSKQAAKNKLFHLERQGALCFGPGWGTTTSTGYSPSSRLKSTTANLMSSTACARFFCSAVRQNCRHNFFHYHQVCAASSQGINCNGDSGGPLVCGGRLVGVVSWKFQCRIGWPHVYSDLAPILDVAYPYISKGRP